MRRVCDCSITFVNGRAFSVSGHWSAPRNRSRTLLASCCVVMGLLAPAKVDADDSRRAGTDFFEKQVRPLLAANCTECHGPKKQESGLRLDTASGLFQGGESGPVVVPGDLESSLLLNAVSYTDQALLMPPDGRLTDEAIAVLRKWIELGAPHPDGIPPEAATRKGTDDLQARNFWAFRPIEKPALPRLTRTDWAESPVDALLMADWDAHGLTPAETLSKRMLIRRATYDLIGLPPTPEEIRAFLEDESPAAFERVVERLLASPAYGERWGRHWLDVVRYADSSGAGEDVAYANAWRYRDYVVDAFNRDMPFDEFVVEQIAGDLLPEESENRERRLIATGFLALGPKELSEADVPKMLMDVADEQIDTIGRGFLALTLGCARCHDHKFDPISARDYYALAGIFKSTKTLEDERTFGGLVSRWIENDLASEADVASHQKQQELIAAKEAEIRQAAQGTSEGPSAPPGASQSSKSDKPVPSEQHLKSLREEVVALKQALPDLPKAMGVRDLEPVNARIHIRGSHLSLGAEVERGVPAVLRQNAQGPRSSGSIGRLELARWISAGDNPLTARVLVNRVWRWHFGRGIVASTDDFGHLGERPVNQPLLDWLARDFIDSGWSIKHLHRQIMHSAVYRLDSRASALNTSSDSDNQHHWRANVHRLEAEAIRDALLSVGGRLESTMGGTELSFPNRAPVARSGDKSPRYATSRRSVYLPVIRNNLFDGFALFDLSDASVVIGDRRTSTVAPQALYMMNGDLWHQAAEASAKRLIEEFPSAPTSRILRLYELAYGRPPRNHEVSRLIELVRNTSEDLRLSIPDEAEVEQRAWTVACHAVLMTNEFIHLR